MLRGRLAGCSSWPLRFADYSNGATLNRGKWVYLYRAVDCTGATIDFLLWAKRDAAAAERFLTRRGVRRERRSVYCNTSCSVCSLRRAKFSIIYPDLRLDYKVATQPSGESHKRKTPRDRLWSHYSPLSILGKRLFLSDIDICKSIVQTYHQEDLDERNQVERYGIAAFDPIGNKGVT